MDSPFYHESEYYFLSYFFAFDKMLIAKEKGCQHFFDCDSSISMPSFLTTLSMQWTKEQLQVRLNTNFQYEAMMLKICRAKALFSRGQKLKIQQRQKSLGRNGFTLVALVVNSHGSGQH